MDLSCLVLMVQTDGCVVMLGEKNWATLGDLVLTEHLLNTTVYPSTNADHVHPFKTIVYLYSSGWVS